jgi:hypothetical protein
LVLRMAHAYEQATAWRKRTLTTRSVNIQIKA